MTKRSLYIATIATFISVACVCHFFTKNTKNKKNRKKRQLSKTQRKKILSTAEQKRLNKLYSHKSIMWVLHFFEKNPSKSAPQDFEFSLNCAKFAVDYTTDLIAQRDLSETKINGKFPKNSEQLKNNIDKLYTIATKLKDKNECFDLILSLSSALGLYKELNRDLAKLTDFKGYPFPLSSLYNLMFCSVLVGRWKLFLLFYYEVRNSGLSLQYPLTPKINCIHKILSNNTSFPLKHSLLSSETDIAPLGDYNYNIETFSVRSTNEKTQENSPFSDSPFKGKLSLTGATCELLLESKKEGDKFKLPIFYGVLNGGNIVLCNVEGDCSLIFEKIGLGVLKNVGRSDWVGRGVFKRKNENLDEFEIALSLGNEMIKC